MKHREDWLRGFLGTVHASQKLGVWQLVSKPRMAARVTIDALREKIARIEAEIGTQVSRLDAEIGTTSEVNTTLSTQLIEAFLLLDSQRDLMESRKRAFASDL